ncbi:MAG: response regulator transcription factor [Firmicutes bacterium]|nr:response regulator transcription factor [Bacillota bacterium]
MRRRVEPHAAARGNAWKRSRAAGRASGRKEAASGRRRPAEVTGLASILVVEDETAIADIIRFNLEEAGFTVRVAADGEQALREVDASRPDLLVLDLMLPLVDGYAVCQAVRARSSVPILMLTAKDSEEDKIRGLEMGADDYVTKPFSPRELVARVRAILRRRQAAAEPPPAEPLRVGELEIRMASREVFRSGRPVALTTREYELLEYLALRPGRLFQRDELLREVWGYEYPGDLRTVDVTVRRLREKIEPDPSHPRYLLTRRGAGYMLQLPELAAEPPE